MHPHTRAPLQPRPPQHRERERGGGGTLAGRRVHGDGVCRPRSQSRYARRVYSSRAGAVCAQASPASLRAWCVRAQAACGRAWFCGACVGLRAHAFQPPPCCTRRSDGGPHDAALQHSRGEDAHAAAAEVRGGRRGRGAARVRARFVLLLCTQQCASCCHRLPCARTRALST